MNMTKKLLVTIIMMLVAALAVDVFAMDASDEDGDKEAVATGVPFVVRCESNEP